MGPDFSGWATKTGLVCSDGRTIMPDAFKHQDKMRVPLVYQHNHDEPENVLGHAILSNRPEGVYVDAFFNSTDRGQLSKALVQHKDITQLSIYANQLTEKLMNGGKQVIHGMIREVSLVLAGANPGAMIDFVAIQHGDGTVEQFDDAAFIYTGEAFAHVDGESSSDENGPSPKDVYDSMSEDQKNLLHFMVDAALSGESVEHSDTDEKKDEETEDESNDESTDEQDKKDDTSDDKSDDQSGEDDISHKEGTTVTNVFEKDGKTASGSDHVLTHDAMAGILTNAQLPGQTLKSAAKAYALEHGIEDIETLFPEAKSLQDRPEWVKRQTEWVAGVINGTRKTPFSRIKTMSADLTFEDARAKGYIKGNLKKEQFFGLQKRTTGPQTIYKKQKLDRDDIVDITDFDVVAWLKEEMRFMLEEEIARAILIGDGRAVDDEDKIKDPAGSQDGNGIRSILNDHELYVTRVYVNLLDEDSDYEELVESILLARRFYRGSGRPTFYTTEETLTRMLLSKDGFQRRRYNTEAELASALRVSSIVAVEVMESEPDVVGILVNLSDFALGTDKGGQVAWFEDFDIDYNQQKYLIETRLSGALTKLKSAQVVMQTESASVLIAPTVPTFVESTGVVTIPTQTGVTYKDASDDSTLTAGAQSALAAGESIEVVAVTDSTHHFETGDEDSWTFTRPSA